MIEQPSRALVPVAGEVAALVPRLDLAPGTHLGTAGITAALRDLFWSHVQMNPPPGCWPWLGSVDRRGKPRFSFTVAGTYHAFFAQRVAWELVNGPLPSAMPIRATCKNPLCCNPFHLKAEPARDSIWTTIRDLNPSLWADVMDFRRGLEDRNYRPSTITTYVGVLGLLCRYVSVTFPEVKSIREVTRLHIVAFSHALREDGAGSGEPKTPRTRAKYLNTIRAMLKWFNQNTEITVLSRDKVAIPRLGEFLPRAVATPADVQKLVDACNPATEKGRRDRAILGLLFASGLRIGELVSLDRAAFPAEALGADDILAVRVVGKGGQERLVYVGADAQHLLRATLADRSDTDPALFVNVRPGQVEKRERRTARGGTIDRRLTPRGIQVMMHERLTAAGLPANLTPHSLRHGLATDLVENDVEIRQIQGILGHKNVNTTMVYTRLSNKAQRAAYLKRTPLLVGPREEAPASA